MDYDDTDTILLHFHLVNRAIVEYLEAYTFKHGYTQLL